MKRTFKNPFEAIGLTDHQKKRMYHQWCKVVHPDRCHDLAPGLKEAAQEIFKTIDQLYRIAQPPPSSDVAEDDVPSPSRPTKRPASPTSSATTSPEPSRKRTKSNDSTHHPGYPEDHPYDLNSTPGPRRFGHRVHITPAATGWAPMLDAYPSFRVPNNLRDPYMGSGFKLVSLFFVYSNSLYSPR